MRRRRFARRRESVHPDPHQPSQGAVARQVVLIGRRIIYSQLTLVAVVHRPRIQGSLDLPAQL
ncbi:MAG: hypothetical protein M3R63_03680, partial [Actinomycetota bacterium]|nr:hypothetical protein [Actinomycetota bacterium]